MIRKLATLIRRHYRGIPDHALTGSASKPMEPVVASMPAQRGYMLPVDVIPEAEREAIAKLLNGQATEEERALVRDYCSFVDMMWRVEG